MTRPPEFGDVYAAGAMVVGVGGGDVTVLESDQGHAIFGVKLKKLRVDDLDPHLLAPATIGYLHRVARQIGRHLGERQGGYLVGHDRELFDLIVPLLDRADELQDEALAVIAIEAGRAS